MPRLYDHYQQGFYQEIYDELVAMGERVFEHPVYDDALLVAKAIMKRVRYNIEILVPRLRDIGYQFGKGFWDQFYEGMSSEEVAKMQEDMPIFRAPTSETSAHIVALEQYVGTLPFSLRCWYEEVGAVNLVGLFSPAEDRDLGIEYGYILDPLLVYSVEMALEMVTAYNEVGGWVRDPTLPLSPDQYYKYGFGGSATYSVKLPNKSFDALLLHEPHNTTFVNYLRICLRWGGFPGLEKECRLSANELEYLTKDLLLF